MPQDSFSLPRIDRSRSATHGATARLANGAATLEIAARRGFHAAHVARDALAATTRRHPAVVLGAVAIGALIFGRRQRRG